MIKQAMSTLFKKTESKNREIRRTKEVHQTHHVHHVHNVESTERVDAVKKRMQEAEADATAEITKLSKYITEVKSKLASDEAARLKSDADLTILQEQVLVLFKKVQTNTDKLNDLDAKI